MQQLPLILFQHLTILSLRLPESDLVSVYLVTLSVAINLFQLPLNLGKALGCTVFLDKESKSYLLHKKKNPT